MTRLQSVTVAALLSSAWACSSNTDPAATSSADLTATPTSGCAPAAEGQICGTDAAIACGAGLVCEAPPSSLLAFHPAGVCRSPSRPPAASPSPPTCAPAKLGEICETKAKIGCGPGLSCRLPDTGTGLVVPSGRCRAAAGGKCAPRPIESDCDDFLMCDFDPVADPKGEHGTCVSPRAIDAHDCHANIAGNDCPTGMSCVVVDEPCPAGPCTLHTFCQKLPAIRQLGESCGGASGFPCVSGLVCHIPSGFLPGSSRTCVHPEDINTCGGVNAACKVDGDCCLHHCALGLCSL